MTATLTGPAPTPATESEPSAAAAPAEDAASTSMRPTRRFLLRLLTAFAIAVVAVGFVHYVLQARAMEQLFVQNGLDRHEAESTHLQAMMESSQRATGDPLDGARMFFASIVGHDVEEALLLDRNGVTVAASDEDELGEVHNDDVLAVLQEVGGSFSGLVDHDGERVFEYATHVQSGDTRYVYEVQLSTSTLDARLSDLKWTVAWNSVLALLLGAPLFYFLGALPLSRLYGRVERLQRERTALLDATVRGAEEERTRLAAELHDGPIQRLAALTFDLESADLALGAGDHGEAQEILGQLVPDVGAEVDGLRRLMTDLRPPILDQRGIEAALRELGADFERRQGITTTVHAHLAADIPISQETVIYRVAQEALTNVAKHAAASSVVINVEADQDGTRLSVEDDGRGFDTAAPRREGHVGLAVMRERVTLLDGNWVIKSRPGAGTTIVATLPRVG